MHPTLMGLLAGQLYEERLRAREAQRRAAGLGAGGTPVRARVRRWVGGALVRLGRAVGALGERVAASADRAVGGLR